MKLYQRFYQYYSTRLAWSVRIHIALQFVTKAFENDRLKHLLRCNILKTFLFFIKLKGYLKVIGLLKYEYFRKRSQNLIISSKRGFCYKNTKRSLIYTVSVARKDETVKEHRFVILMTSNHFHKVYLLEMIQAWR